MRLYHEGDRGAPVRDIQDRLVALGFTLADDPPDTYAGGTVAAVAAFQATRGLPGDGIVGPETWRALVDAGHALGDRMLYRRVPMMRGDDVSELQRRLNALGFDSGKVDGIFGPDTLHALLDFQANRGMAEDGIAGREVAAELELMSRATEKAGRDVVREREWLANLPMSIAGQRIYVDPDCHDTETAARTWKGAVALTRYLRDHGARALLSHSIDTTPPERIRATRANRLDAQIVVSLTISEQRTVYYFRSEHSRSAAGEAIAVRVAARIGATAQGRATPILKETRAPAIVVGAPVIDPELGIETAEELVAIYADPPEIPENS